MTNMASRATPQVSEAMMPGDDQPQALPVYAKQDKSGTNTERERTGRVKAHTRLFFGVAQQPPRQQCSSNTQRGLGEKNHSPTDGLNERHACDHAKHRCAGRNERPRRKRAHPFMRFEHAVDERHGRWPRRRTAGCRERAQRNQPECGWGEGCKAGEESGAEQSPDEDSFVADKIAEATKCRTRNRKREHRSSYRPTHDADC